MSVSPRVLILLLAAACAKAGDTPTDPTDQRFTVRGTVYDSLAREVGGDWAAADVRISVNGIRTVTDSTGRFTADNVGGADHAVIVVESQHYERMELPVTIDGDLTVEIGLLRHAPLITGFYPSGDSTRVAIVDLQNRKTVERWQLTHALLRAGPTQQVQRGIQWIWTPVDDVTWLVSMPSTMGAEAFEFEIHDVTGFSSQAACRVASGCDHLETVAGTGP